MHRSGLRDPHARRSVGRQAPQWVCGRPHASSTDPLVGPSHRPAGTFSNGVARRCRHRCRAGHPGRVSRPFGTLLRERVQRDSGGRRVFHAAESADHGRTAFRTAAPALRGRASRCRPRYGYRGARPRGGRGAGRVRRDAGRARSRRDRACRRRAHRVRAGPTGRARRCRRPGRRGDRVRPRQARPVRGRPLPALGCPGRRGLYRSAQPAAAAGAGPAAAVDERYRFGGDHRGRSEAALRAVKLGGGPG